MNVRSAQESPRERKKIRHRLALDETPDKRTSLHVIASRVITCTRCPELRGYCAEVASAKRRAFADWDYWGKPVPGFGDPEAEIVIVGLAPAAHGGNRTGRVFTGDRSGDFLYAALHRAGLSNQPHSVSRLDGLELKNVYITAAARCAPPANKPTPAQLRNCAPYLRNELAVLQPRVVLTLGGIAWNQTLAILQAQGVPVPRPRPAFAHGAEIPLAICTLLGCYHVSQQNTFTGRLTPAMIDGVLDRARQIVSAATAGKPAR